MINKEISQEKAVVYEGAILTLEKYEVLTQAGRRAHREIIRHAPGVVILGRTLDGKIPFLTQFRFPFLGPVLELPAGKVDPGEDPKVAAAREFEEETGYVADNLTFLGKALPSPGYSDEVIYCYECQVGEKGSLSKDVDESFDYEELTPGEIKERIQQGELTDAKSLCALYLAGVS